MRLIVITPPTKVAREKVSLIRMFELGLEVLHVRKPGIEAEEMKEWLKQIPGEFKDRLMLHQFHELSPGGVHIGNHFRKNSPETELRDALQKWQTAGKSISMAVHQLATIESWADQVDYFLVSPVFDSISKPGYRRNPALTPAGYKPTGKSGLIALGGIMKSNIQMAKKMGYDGVAVLGSIWQDPGNSVEQFLELQKECARCARLC